MDGISRKVFLSWAKESRRERPLPTILNLSVQFNQHQLSSYFMPSPALDLSPYRSLHWARETIIAQRRPCSSELPRYPRQLNTSTNYRSQCWNDLSCSPQGWRMCLIHLCDPAGPAQSLALNRHSKVCWILMNPLQFYIHYWHLTATRHNPFFYISLVSLHLPVPKSLPENVNIWRQAPLCDSLTDRPEPFLQWMPTSPPVLPLASKTSVLMFRFPQEQTMEKDSRCK